MFKKKQEKSEIQVTILYLNSGVWYNSSSINHNLLVMKTVMYIQQVNNKDANDIGERGKIGYTDMNNSQEDNLGEGLHLRSA